MFFLFISVFIFVCFVSEVILVVVCLKVFCLFYVLNEGIVINDRRLIIVSIISIFISVNLFNFCCGMFSLLLDV